MNDLDFKVVIIVVHELHSITLSRFGRKFSEAPFGTQICPVQKSAKENLDSDLMPAAWVTVGLVLNAREILGDNPMSNIMVSAVLGVVIINQLLSPPLVRFSLSKAGEISQLYKQKTENSLVSN